MKDIFPISKNPHTLGHNSLFSKTSAKKNLYHGTEGMSNLRPKMWHLIPSRLKGICDSETSGLKMETIVLSKYSSSFISDVMFLIV